MKKAATLMIYISSFASLIFIMFTFSIILIIMNDFYLKFLAIVLFLWLITFFLTIQVTEKEKEVRRANKR